MANFGMVESEQKLERSEKIRLCILGSTGSIGKSALQVVRSHPERFEVVALVAGSNSDELARQIIEFRPRVAALANEKAFLKLTKSIPTGLCCEIGCGTASIDEIVSRSDVDTVLAAIVGFAGLRSVIAALKANKVVALANKESLVCGGALVKDLVEAGHGRIIPVDSEHSAIFQVLQAQYPENIKSLILTASGGPFWQMPIDKFAEVTVEQALNHPRWKMGPKVTVDSATMMNKALEVIEAHWLFGIKEINVLVHPQSVVHSLIELIDGSQLAQLGVPDMKAPIAYALCYPDRLASVVVPLNLATVGKLEFYNIDDTKFPAVRLAKLAISQGGIATAVFNIANEEAVSLFLAGKLAFYRIVPFVEKALESYGNGEYSSFEELEEIISTVKAQLVVN